MSWHSKAAHRWTATVRTGVHGVSTTPFPFSVIHDKQNQCFKGLVWQSKHRTTKLEHVHENITFFLFLLTLTTFARFPFTRSHIHPHFFPRLRRDQCSRTVHTSCKSWAYCARELQDGSYKGTKQWVKWKKKEEKKKKEKKKRTSHWRSRRI